jgi:hypothetical protein
MRIKLKTSGVLAGLSIAALAAVALPGAAAAAASSLPVIRVTMNGKHITVGGVLQSGGSQIVSTVTGESAGEPTFIRLDPGVTVAQFFSVLSGPGANDPNYLEGIGAIVVDAFAGHGTSAVQASLAAGQYVAIDSVGNNPAKWPFTTFVITQAANPARLPTPQATIAAIDFGFKGPGTLHDGQLVRFVNRGFVVHMIVAVEAPDAATAGKIVQLLKAGNDGAAQRLSIGFAAFAGPLSRGGGQQLVIHDSPGYWVLSCFMNSQDGREHTVLGMVRVIRIVR